MENRSCIKLLRYIIQNDETYQRMLEDFRLREAQFEQTVGELSVDVQDVIWDYVSASDALDEYALEIAARVIDKTR